MNNKDKGRGIYQKFEVDRKDLRDCVGDKHEFCEYFVLDLDHDPFAVPALEAYAAACEKEYPNLATDLRRKAKETYVNTQEAA